MRLRLFLRLLWILERGSGRRFNWRGAWAANVEKIYRDRSLTAADLKAWSEHDLAGALFARDRLESGLRTLPVALQERMQGCIDVADDLYRSFTVADSGRRMSRIAQIEPTGMGWWWFRVPGDGPIAEDLATYTD
jgi:hypothetical protein